MSDKPEVKVDEKAVLEILETKNVTTYFQPVVSLASRSIIGFEAFSRGGGGDVCVIDPTMLFHKDLPSKLKIDIDRMCREKALEQFKSIHDQHPSMTLFLNVNSEILAHVETGSRVLKHQVASMDIDLKNVAIECPLNQSGGRMIIEFAELYKEFGFNLSLDNCGVDDPYGHLISTLKPSYVKINPSFYSESSATDYSAKALESVVEMAERMGAVVVAQGVESEDDSIRLLTAGVHLQQGYYYTKDENDTSGDPAKVFFKKIVDTSERYKKVRRDLVRSKKMRLDATFRIMSTMCSKLSNMQESRFDAVCNLQVSSVDEIISMFVLNEHGQQVTSRPHITPRGPIKSAKALGTEKGADHAVRDYFMYLDMGYEKFVTQPFISPFTNEDACLISMPIYNTEGIRFVVCIEMPYPK